MSEDVSQTGRTFNRFTSGRDFVKAQWINVTVSFDMCIVCVLKAAFKGGDLKQFEMSGKVERDSCSVDGCSLLPQFHFSKMKSTELDEGLSGLNFKAYGVISSNRMDEEDSHDD